jgi:hypothetical protein
VSVEKSQHSEIPEVKAGAWCLTSHLRQRGMRVDPWTLRFSMWSARAQACHARSSANPIGPVRRIEPDSDECHVADAVARGETPRVRTESPGRESAGGASWLVRPRPTDNPTTPSDDLTAIQDEDRHGPLAAELLDLCTITPSEGQVQGRRRPPITGLISYVCPTSSRAFAARPHGWASGGGGLPANFSNEQV